jgi:hypothetical protein
MRRHSGKQEKLLARIVMDKTGQMNFFLFGDYLAIDIRTGELIEWNRLCKIVNSSRALLDAKEKEMNGRPMPSGPWHDLADAMAPVSGE